MIRPDVHVSTCATIYHNICENKNVKEMVNALNIAEKLESDCFDRSCQNGAFGYLKYFQCYMNTVFCKWGILEYCRNGRG